MKETKQAILFLAAIAAQTIESATDGDGLNFKDAPEFLDELMQAPEAFIGIDKVPDEIKNATSEERSALYLEVSEIVQGLTPDRFDAFVDAAAKVGVALEISLSQFRAVKDLETT